MTITPGYFPIILGLEFEFYYFYLLIFSIRSFKLFGVYVLAKKKKLSKKQIKEDKLVSLSNKALTFYENYQQKIIIAVGIIAIVIIAVLLYMNNKQKNNEEATTYLARIMPSYDMGSYQKAIDGESGTNVLGLKQIVEDYGSTQQGNYAKIYLANSYFFLGYFDEALKYYSDYSGSNPLFEAAAYAGIAGCYESKNNFESAAENFKKAAFISEANPSNPDYLLKAGIDFLKVRNYDEAKRLLDLILTDYANSNQKQDADRYIAAVEVFKDNEENE